ncbi:MAG TPA: DMT family transporter [Streptosporangiaceae bacterium]|nr:DMT family transporter [Streptosporangiaceae bacterium]
METAILLAVAASLCTATSSVCQRIGAKNTPTTGFDAGLVFRLARQPVWLLGIASMIGGFLLQLIALHFGELALVQPILAAELVFVFGYLAVAGSGRIKRRDWLAAAAMSAGIGVFLRVASPSGGRLHAPGSSWLVAGLATAGVVGLAVAATSGLGRRPGGSGTRRRPGGHDGGTRRAAVLGAATGVSWGFMAAVIKELSSHLDDGIGAVFSSWSLYVLIAAGAATMLLASHALAAGPLAASQPGFTILDPLSASLLGTFLFGEHIRTGPGDLAGEALALTAVIVAAAVLSRSCHLADQDRRSAPQPRLPVPRLAGNGLQIGQQKVAVLAVGNARGGGQGLVGAVPGRAGLPGHGVAAGQRLVGEGQVEVAEAVLLAQVKDPACVMQRGLGPAENRVDPGDQPFPASQVHRGRFGDLAPVVARGVRGVDHAIVVRPGPPLLVQQPPGLVEQLTGQQFLVGDAAGARRALGAHGKFRHMTTVEPRPGLGQRTRGDPAHIPLPGLVLDHVDAVFPGDERDGGGAAPGQLPSGLRKPRVMLGEH